MDQAIQPGSPDDMCVWPDATWCYRSELGEMLGHKSDDFRVIPVDSEDWKVFHEVD